jgi:WD40 repeat protein
MQMIDRKSFEHHQITSLLAGIVIFSSLFATGCTISPAPKQPTKEVLSSTLTPQENIPVAQPSGYIPGVGIVDQSSPVRILAKPVTQTRDGITLTVKEVYLTDEKTIVTYMIENVPNSALSHDENVVGCADSGNLVLSDGTIVKVMGGWGSQVESNNIYPPIPESMATVNFVLPCLRGTLPGKAPEDWELTLHFVSAPPEMTVAPVIAIPTPTSPTIRTTQVVQTQSAAQDLFGIKLVLDQAIPLDDGYYLLGHTDWNDNRITAVGSGGWAMKAYDSSGQEVALEPANWGEAGLTLEPNQWLYRLYGQVFNGALTLRTTNIGVEFVQPVDLEFDPRSFGFNGDDRQLNTTWKIEPITLDVYGMDARVIQIKYMQQGEQTGFELGIEAEPRLQSLPFNLVSTVTGGRGGSGGGSNRDDASGLILTYVLSDGEMPFPLMLSASSMTLTGIWDTSWNPPSNDTRLTPTPMPQACLTLEKWQQAFENPTALPLDLQGKVLLSRGALAPNPSLFISNLDGSGEQGLVFGDGSLSSDGTKLVYADSTASILVLDLKSGQETTLTSGLNDSKPLWSPDGRQIAFMRLGDSQQIYLMNADGTGLKSVISGMDHPQAWGWTPDGRQILYGIRAVDGNNLLRLVNPSTGDISDLFAVPFDSPMPVYSPDGKWIAYLDSVPGRMANGLYLSHPDGTSKRLAIQLDYWPVSNVSWSPDGKWLAFNGINTDLFTPTSTTGLLNVETCQVIPLPQLNGAIQSWVNP